jgi:hypothetical protein
MKRALPANAKISKEAKETMQECVSEFILFITSEYRFLLPFVFSHSRNNISLKVYRGYLTRKEPVTAAIQKNGKP